MLQFAWSTSSQYGADWLNFYVDGVLFNRLSGYSSWRRQYMYLGPGVHKIRWEYERDYCCYSGYNRGYLDEVSFTPLNNVPTLGEALDQPNWSFGNSDWSAHLGEKIVGDSSASSRAIGHNQSSRLETFVEGLAVVSFQWKVSSEEGGDFLQFYINGELKDEISGSTNWAPRTYIVYGGNNLLEWVYTKDGSVSRYLDAGFVDGLEYRPPVESGDLAAALDNDDLHWSSNGNNSWFNQNFDVFSDGDAARSGVIGHGEQSTLRTAVVGPGALSFVWKTSSEAGADFLRFSVNGDEYRAISGATAWEPIVLILDEGPQMLTWRYTKDSGGNDGLDAGFVDLVQWLPEDEGNGSIPPLFLTGELPAATAGINYQFAVRAEDVEGDSFIFSLLNAPSGMTIQPGTGLLTWSNPLVGDHSLTIQVRDEVGASNARTFTLLVASDPATLPPDWTRDGGFFFEVDLTAPTAGILVN